MTKWQRARTDKQKAERIDAILAATARLFEKNDFEDITLVMIAKEAKFTRSNLYKYFNTREEIFLALIEEDSEEWIKRLMKKLGSMDSCPPEKFADTWCSALLEQKRMLKLFPVMHSFLEKNASQEYLIEYKKKSAVQSQPVMDMVMRSVLGLTPEKVMEFMYLQLAVVAGLYPLANPGEKIKKAMQESPYKDIPMDFESYLRDAITGILKHLVG